MSKIAIILIGIIVLIIVVCIVLVEVAFKRAFTKHKKTEEEAYEYLRKKNMLDKEIYNEVNREEVFIESHDNLKLKGYLMESYKESNKYIILVHGFTANNHIHMAFARFFINEGFNVLAIDQRNHGNSEGKYPSYGYFESMDIDRWIEFLYRRTGKELFLGLHGQSMGGATVLICGSRNDKVDFIIDDCGYSNAKDEIRWELSKVKGVYVDFIYLLLRIKARVQIGFDIEKTSPRDEIIKCKKPIMFIHGDADKLVPCKMAYEMYNLRNNENDVLYIVKGADHMWSYPKEKKEYERKVHNFIEKLEKTKENNHI